MSDEAGSQLAEELDKVLLFDARLAELSAQFINIPASQVDSQIEWGLRWVVDILDIDRCGLGEASADGSQLVVTHSFQVPGVPPSTRIMVSTQLPWFAAQIFKGEVVRVPDDLPHEATQERAYCQSVGLKSNITIPLIAMGRVVGGIGFSSFRASVCLPDALIPRLRLVGDIFTHALARKRTDEALSAKERLLRQAKDDLRHLASRLIHSQEEERRRIAREMHDDWAQRLAILGIDVAKLEGSLAVTPALVPALHAIQMELARLAEDVHALSRQLHPSILADLGLVEALRSECAGFCAREGIAVDFRTQDVPTRLPPDLALCLYRVTQESLRNVARHAVVNQAAVALVATGSELNLQVSDQGVGFDPLEKRSLPGLGLSSMKERVRLVEGRLVIHSAPGAGTTVEVCVALDACTHNE